MDEATVGPGVVQRRGVVQPEVLDVDAPEVAGEPTVQVLMDPDQNSLASRVQPPFDQGNQIEVADTRDVVTGR
jgi:hypothetical protein